MSPHLPGGSQVSIQISPQSVPSMPSWFGEVVAFAQILSHEGILEAIQEQVHFARARFGTYDLIDFVAVLIGYSLSGEPTLLAFYERLAPFAGPFMALFGRNLLPHRSTLSRRAHWRLSWEQRLARNARPSNAPRLSVTLHVLPATFARFFGFDLLAAA